jgi:aspartyl-tRNA(Asn)/glutamyl-tRNA(Gln) amidotransferase subunit A
VRTTAHSKILVDHVPGEDATSVARLADAGTILLGKLATHEFAFGGPSFDLPWPPARNPWNLDHVTGGSSSGTGAAVAAGFVLGGTGSDTGGSIRHPCANCGVSGIKPTYGLVSRAGIFPLSFTQDHAGPMAWTVEDCALMLQAMAGYDARDPASVDIAIPDYRAALREDLRGVRIGLIRHFHEEEFPVEPEALKAVDDAVAIMRGLGAEIRDVRLPPLELFNAASYVIMLAEGFAVHQEDMQKRFDDFGEIFRMRIALGALYSAADYVQAQRLRRQLIDDTRRATADLDVIVTAGSPGPAPTFASFDKYGLFRRAPLTTPWNITGAPVVTVCCGVSASGLPLALQIGAAPFEDATALAVSHAYQKATPWRRQRPPLNS